MVGPGAAWGGSADELRACGVRGEAAMRRSWKRGQAAQRSPQLSAPLALDADKPASTSEACAASFGVSGGSPASGIAPPSDPLSEEAIFERTSATGWYMVDDDGFNRPVAYRRTPRFDDRAERTAPPRMLFRSVEELPEWVQASNRLWLVRSPPSSPCGALFAHLRIDLLIPCAICVRSHVASFQWPIHRRLGRLELAPLRQ